MMKILFDLLENARMVHICYKKSLWTDNSGHREPKESKSKFCNFEIQGDPKWPATFVFSITHIAGKKRKYELLVLNLYSKATASVFLVSWSSLVQIARCFRWQKILQKNFCTRITSLPFASYGKKPKMWIYLSSWREFTAGRFE